MGMCVAIIKTTGAVPNWCNCMDKVALGSMPQKVHKHKGVPQHSTKDLSKKAFGHVEALTQMDHALYAWGLARFKSDVKELERKHNIRLLCIDTVASTNITTLRGTNITICAVLVLAICFFSIIYLAYCWRKRTGLGERGSPAIVSAPYAVI